MSPVDPSSEDENSSQRETTEVQSHSVVLNSNPDPEVSLSGPHNDHDNDPARIPQEESPSSKQKR
uniref:Mannosyl-oligosaccharide 1,2-alpha-mannosidase IA n=2 Tax=Solanum tuberosum TaxID=4113 RepID=M1BCA2_SOLTU